VIMLGFLSLFFGTFISEDLACITAGLLIQRGELSAWSGVLACVLGIVVGDVGLWGAGRLCGRAALAWPQVARQLQNVRLNDLRSWLDRHAGGAIVGSRFLPGTRLPLYVLAGVVELPGGVFASWALVGALLWTPALVFLAAGLGDAFGAGPSLMSGVDWLPRLLAVAAVFSLLCAVRAVVSRRRLVRRCVQVWRRAWFQCAISSKVI
jgi:membrane protein DedA with SNARE-associated domain